MSETRKCACCKEVKSIDNFYKSGKYMGSYCKPCYALKHFKNNVFEPVENLKGEVWEDIFEYEGKYQVSNLGRVKSLNYNHSKQEKLRKICYQKKSGYGIVILHSNNKSKGFLIQRLVAIAFILNPENKPEVNHKNGNKTDNRVENLEWNTSKENIEHGINNGFIKDIKGASNYFSVLTENDVLEIRKIHQKNDVKYKDTAKKYNTTPENISMIVRRKSWKHI